MSEGLNWRKTLAHYASISGVLGGFCVAFIGIVLGWSVADTEIFNGITFGNISVLLFGTSVCLFIAGAEFFLIAKNFDMFDLTKRYEEWLSSEYSKEKWYEIRNRSHRSCQTNETYGRCCYNVAVYLMFIGLGLAIFPYSPLSAIIVTGLGVILETIQLAN